MTCPSSLFSFASLSPRCPLSLTHSSLPSQAFYMTFVAVPLECSSPNFYKVVSSSCDHLSAFPDQPATPTRHSLSYCPVKCSQELASLTKTVLIILLHISCKFSVRTKHCLFISAFSMLRIISAVKQALIKWMNEECKEENALVPWNSLGNARNEWEWE